MRYFADVIDSHGQWPKSMIRQCPSTTLASGLWQQGKHKQPGEIWICSMIDHKGYWTAKPPLSTEHIQVYWKWVVLRWKRLLLQEAWKSISLRRLNQDHLPVSGLCQNFHQSHKTTMHCNLSRMHWTCRYTKSIFIQSHKGWQQIVLWPTESPTADRLGLFNSLVHNGKDDLYEAQNQRKIQ